MARTRTPPKTLQLCGWRKLAQMDSNHHDWPPSTVTSWTSCAPEYRAGYRAGEGSLNLPGGPSADALGRAQIAVALGERERAMELLRQLRFDGEFTEGVLDKALRGLSIGENCLGQQ